MANRLHSRVKQEIPAHCAVITVYMESHQGSQSAGLSLPYTSQPSYVRHAPRSCVAIDAWGGRSTSCIYYFFFYCRFRFAGLFLTPSKGFSSLFRQEPALALSSLQSSTARAALASDAGAGWLKQVSCEELGSGRCVKCRKSVTVSLDKMLCMVPLWF